MVALCGVGRKSLLTISIKYKKKILSRFDFYLFLVRATANLLMTDRSDECASCGLTNITQAHHLKRR
jgi:hypothetical protein